MKKYEVMYIVRPTLEGEAVKKIVSDMSQIFIDRGSKILELKELGLKELAYEIEKHRKGIYVWMFVEATTEAVDEFNRVSRINEDVIRFIVVNDEE